MTRQFILSSLKPCLAYSCVPGRQNGSCSEHGIYSAAACLGHQIVVLKIIVTAFLLMSFMLTTAHATTQSAEEVVKSTLDQIIEKMSSEKGNPGVHPENTFELIKKHAVPHFDFPIMCRWILGKNWNKASQVQRYAFINGFKTLVVNTYAKTLMSHSVKEIKYLPVQSDPSSNLAIVKVEIWTDSSVHTIGSANTILLNYKMHINNGEWKVIDIAVNGISLVRSYRGISTSEIRKNGLDSLITKLMERNSKLVSSLSQSQ
ncbi:MAG: phospholipid-binding protein MlaC [Gammaproteobacteria bacterium]